MFQKRLDGSVTFYRGWTDYKNGFGDLNGEFKNKEKASSRSDGHQRPHCLLPPSSAVYTIEPDRFGCF